MRSQEMYSSTCEQRSSRDRAVLRYSPWTQTTVNIGLYFGSDVAFTGVVCIQAVARIIFFRMFLLIIIMMCPLLNFAGSGGFMI